MQASGKMRSVPVADDEAHRVQPDYRQPVTTPIPGAETLYDLATLGFKEYAEHRCMGYRDFLGWKSKKVKEFGETHWKTYQEVGEISLKFGAALRAAGLVPAPPTTTLAKVQTNSRLAIFENTCPAWMMSALGAFSQSITVTTIYATLGMDAVEVAVNDNIISVIVCNKTQVKALVERQKHMKTLKTIVYTNDLVAPNDDIALPTPPKGMSIMSFDEFVQSGDTEKFPPSPPKADTTAVIMYTSGTFQCCS